MYIQKKKKEIIGQYDGDKNGEVTINEAIEFFKRMGSKYPEKCAIVLFKMYDLDNEGMNFLFFFIIIIYSFFIYRIIFNFKCI